MCAKEREFGGREWMTFYDKVIEAAARYGVDANLLLRKKSFCFPGIWVKPIFLISLLQIIYSYVQHIDGSSIIELVNTE